MSDIFLKFNENLFTIHKVTNKHGSRKQENNSFVRRIKHDIPKMFQIVPCVISDLSWKFREVPFIRFSLVLLTHISPHTPSVYHCHSTHICIWIWPSDGPHGYFSNKQAEVSTGEKTYDTTVYKVRKHIAWSKHAVKSWLYVEHPAGWMLFAWHFFDHHLDTEKRLSTTQHYFVSPIGMFWGYTPARPYLIVRFNNSRVLCIISNTIIPIDMRF